MIAAAATAPSADEEPQRSILRMRGVSKRFPGVLALEDVHLEVRVFEHAAASRAR